MYIQPVASILLPSSYYMYIIHVHTCTYNVILESEKKCMLYMYMSFTAVSGIHTCVQVFQCQYNCSYHYH